jgi:hypothetical protein
LGRLVRTNSEAVLVVSVPEGRAEALSKRVAITSSIYPDPHTHIETVTYGPGGGAIRNLFTVLTGGARGKVNSIELGALPIPGRTASGDPEPVRVSAG